MTLVCLLVTLGVAKPGRLAEAATNQV